MQIMNGDHAQFEIEHANTKPEDRPDWPYPSFDARDWAKCFCKIATDLGCRDAEGKPIDEGWMISWFANSLMRGFDEHASRTQPTNVGWQDISTAPIGEFLLVVFDDDDMRVARYLTDIEYWTDADGADFAYGNSVPTHWHPLPAPPIPLDKGKGGSEKT